MGKLAPPFTVPTLDGKSLSLSNYRGKYVLLDFWSTWCAPCVAEMPNVKALANQFRPKGRLAIIGMTLDEKPGIAASFVKTNHLWWDQAWVGGDAGRAVLDAYPSAGIPDFWLIGPNGQVIANGQRIVQIKPTLLAASAR